MVAPDDGSAADAPILLRAAGVGVLLDVSGPLLPRVLHWGADPGDLDVEERRRLAADLTPAVLPSAFDDGVALTLLPAQADGWAGHPGLAGHRDGSIVHPRFRRSGEVHTVTEGDGAVVLHIEGQDDDAGLAITVVLRLERTGLLRMRYGLANLGRSAFTVDAAHLLLPVPEHATELLDLTGRWCRERAPQRSPFHQGTRMRASRRGRPGHDATLLLVAGTTGFGFRAGEVWAVHVAWSGNHVHLAERLPEGAGAGGAAVLGGGELLASGEIRLAPAERYETPWLVGTWSDEGLDGASARIHRWLRDRPGHPRRPRPLTLNSWEAVYFDHDRQRLDQLADAAARLGVERFVLDDGWFRRRRDDRTGLGDWYVDPTIWPEGLAGFAEYVRALGMEFGLWVEPEMVNADSDLIRAHPDWLLAAPNHQPRLWRHQLALDVANPEAWEHLLARLEALVAETGSAYLKWDHNRDLSEAVHREPPGPAGVSNAGVHAQTVAVYRLIDELRRRHPGLEIESCASGGARIDLEIMQRMDRAWASDTNDPVERQAIERWTGLLLPPELVGSHVGPPVAHTTGRAFDLSFRCLTALFGHAGIEWDVSRCSPAEFNQITAWGALYKELRGLLHSGDVVRVDHPDPGMWLHGVVASDRAQALFCYARTATSPDALPGRLRLPGLNPARQYQVRRRAEAGDAWGVARAQPPWWERGHTSVNGAALSRIGLAAPVIGPGQAVLLHLRTDVGSHGGGHS